jgi:hypothetical protein
MYRLLAALCLAILCTSALARADLFTYRTPDGKLVISNKPPPSVAEQVERRPETGAPLVSGSGSASRPSAEPTEPVKPALKYVDHNPLIITGHDVRSTDVWWKKQVTTWVENRSGRTAAKSVRVKTACYNQYGSRIDTMSDYLSVIPPRRTRGASGTLIIRADEPPTKIECQSSLEWQNVH